MPRTPRIGRPKAADVVYWARRGKFAHATAVHEKFATTLAERHMYEVLTYAVPRGAVDCVRQLLEAGANAREHLLDVAVREGQSECLAALLEHYEGNINDANEYGETLMNRAVRGGRESCVAVLARGGASVDRPPMYYWDSYWLPENVPYEHSPVACSVFTKHAAVTRALIEAGATIATNAYITPLRAAFMQQDVIIFKMLLASAPLPSRAEGYIPQWDLTFDLHAAEVRRRRQTDRARKYERKKGRGRKTSPETFLPMIRLLLLHDDSDVHLFTHSPLGANENE